MKKIVFIMFLLLVSCTTAKIEVTVTPMPTETQSPTSTPTLTLTPIGSSSGNILFTTANVENEKNADLAIINIETKTITKLTDNKNQSISYLFPSISVDGKKIAFGIQHNIETSLADEFPQMMLYIMDFNGENQQKITSIPMYRGDERIEDYVMENHPAFSPDGTQLAYSSNKDSLIKTGILGFSDSEIYVIDLKTFESQQLTKAKGMSIHPSWSPDGSQIAFCSDRDGDFDIYIMNSDGTGKDTNLMKNTTTERYPSWSHNGKYIVYHSDRDGNNNLYIYNIDTKVESQLTDNPASDVTGRWSPDDKWIAFTSDRDGDYEIYIINVATKEEIKITDNSVEDAFVYWIP
ncbi:MAG: hypothetical protein HPY72_01285 [Anaerolineae bacterium]|nr:hypothetical protein [Anaerolineae bacterium]